MNWRPIPDHPNYEVSINGKVRNIRTGLVLKPTVIHRRNRYTLNRKVYFAYRLVWTAFVGPIPPGLTINHIDGNPSNDNIGNLEVMTVLENIQDAVDRYWSQLPKNLTFRHADKIYGTGAPCHLIAASAAANACRLKSPATFENIARRLGLQPLRVMRYKTYLKDDVALIAASIPSKWQRKEPRLRDS